VNDIKGNKSYSFRISEDNGHLLRLIRLLIYIKQICGFLKCRHFAFISRKSMKREKTICLTVFAEHLQKNP
jgi:hypothetical protein